MDMDEVMADTLAEHLRRYNQAFDEDVTLDDLSGKGLWEVTPQDRQKELRAFLDAEDFFEDLPLMPGAQEVLKGLSTRFEIFIATQAMAVPNSLMSCSLGRSDCAMPCSGRARSSDLRRTSLLGCPIRCGFRKTPTALPWINVMRK